MKLRRATLDEMSDVARLYRHTVRTSLPFLPEMHTPEEDIAFFSERLYVTTEVWLAVDEAGDIEGYIAFKPDFIEHLFIRPASQGQGVGVMLLAKAMAASRELSLWTFQKNARARRFYERHGFAVVMETDGQDNEEKEPDVLYRWRRSDDGAVA